MRMRSRPFKLVLATLAAMSASTGSFGVSAVADDGGSGARGPFIRIPGLPPVQLPPGTRVFGPGQGGDEGADKIDGSEPKGDDLDRAFGGRADAFPPRGLPRGTDGFARGSRAKTSKDASRVRPGPALTPEQKQAEIRKALAPKPPFAVTRRKTLDDLYVKLAAAPDVDEAKGIASLINAIWRHSSSDTANLLMTRAESALAAKNYPVALRVLDGLVASQPGWAEAWNARASTRYAAGDLTGAMADVEQVLKLEPNHFLALNGMALILEHTGFRKRALQVYRRELAIYPHQPQIEELVDKLSLEVEGQGI